MKLQLPATAFQPSNRRWSSGPLSCQLSRLLWGERVEDIDGGQVSAVTAPSVRPHRDVHLPHLHLCSGRFCRGTASIVSMVRCFSASAESLVAQSIGVTIRTESGVLPICIVLAPCAALASTEVAAPVVRVLLGVRRLVCQLRLLIRRPVSKSHLLQFRERLHLLSASRVSVRFLATLVSLATAARNPLPLGSAKKHHTFFCCRLSTPARVGNILTVVAKRFRWRNFCSSPRRKHPQCLRQPFPLAKFLFQPETETSSVSAANVSVERKYCCSQVSLVQDSADSTTLLSRLA